MICIVFLPDFGEVHVTFVQILQNYWMQYLLVNSISENKLGNWRENKVMILLFHGPLLFARFISLPSKSNAKAI